MFHSEILASLNSNKNKILSPGLENNHTLKGCSGNFPTWKPWPTRASSSPAPSPSAPPSTSPWTPGERRRKQDELLCWKYKEKNYHISGNDDSWYRLPNRPAMKAHMHNEHQITIFEDIDIEMHGGFRTYRIRQA